MKKQNNLIITLICVVAFVSCQSQQEQKQEPMNVEIMTAEYRNDLSDKHYVGQVEQQSSTALSFSSMGTLKQVLVREGQHVKKGETLAIMDASSAQSALASAKAQLDQANDALTRMKILHDGNALSDIKWVEAQSNVQQAQAQYDLMKKQVTDCNLVAPCSGIVGSDVKNAGEVAVPSETVLKILNIDKVKVNISMPERELSTLKSSTIAHITCGALPEGENQFTSESFVKGVQADAMTHTYEVSFWVNNPSCRLLPGMVCNVNLSECNEHNDVIAVPIRCVQQSADGKLFVWIAIDGKAHRQDVTLGETSGNDIVVTSGINKGDNIIIAGYQKVSENSLIRF